MQAEVSLVAILIIVLLTDLFLKESNPRMMQSVSCILLVVQLVLAIFHAGSSV